MALDNNRPVCSHHQHDYNPRVDRDWPAKFAAYIAENVGGTVRPTARFGIIKQARYVIASEVQAMRRNGWILHSVPRHDLYYVIAAPREQDCGIVGETGETPTDDGETP